MDLVYISKESKQKYESAREGERERSAVGAAAMDAASMASVASKEETKDKDREKDTAARESKEKEKDRESEMEAALYSNCLLLGLDASILGPGGPGSRAGLFRHSNPRVGEALLHFLLCALRGPTLSAKDFAGVWPIFDAAQSRDFRKVVQGLINELEVQGALPRSSSRVSSLATCCGQRFVELLWQLSAHALREVHRRNFPGDVAANPLPASLTEVVTQNSHAAALLAVTKARIALERRRFLESAATAVRRQALWTSLAHDMTAEFRALCAEEAYLHQELEKLQEMQSTKGRPEKPIKNGSAPHSADQKPLTVARASQLWESLLNHAARHETLASGPIEDLIAHREHRYRIDGAALRLAIERSSNILSSAEDLSCKQKNEEDNALQQNGFWHGTSLDSRDAVNNPFDAPGSDDSRVKTDDRAGKASSTVLDVAEVLRRWTHALQRIHKQALRLVRSNEGSGPELVKDALKAGEDGHAHALQTTLAEHKQHLANMQVLISQLKESMPGMEASIAALRQQVNSTDVISASLSSNNPLSGLTKPSEIGTISRESAADNMLEESISPRLSQLDLAPPGPAMKLPQVSVSSPVSARRSNRTQKKVSSISSQPFSGFDDDELVIGASSLGLPQNEDGQDRLHALASLRQAIREAALLKPTLTPEAISERLSTGTEHYFTPVNGNIRDDVVISDLPGWKTASTDATAINELEEQQRPGSPPLLVELSGNYDDLLAPMLDFDAALWEASHT
ncbi:hypothetical protein O6H91_06G025300 [Diphasiastrum complanatum]|uniref:Uncharacterized protein n=2 Tax=Diphasiastrum complanatum TaxID=34168 RepID=A0ACC2DBK2_DIPCM|nr:hypothetical protein O6H91_06G025300 [Diphasiastrum complanatum]KAJ7551700.1 hypothetical protein O6H91_06G025300 [Diphasiastrum complanatum]